MNQWSGVGGVLDWPAWRTQCDVVVIGLGPGGEATATQLAKAGLSVVAVDERLVGGECPYFGCIPSKMIDPRERRAGRGPAASPGSPGRPRCSPTGRRCTPGSVTRPPTTGTTRSRSTGSRTPARVSCVATRSSTGPRTVVVGDEHVRGQARRRAQSGYGALRPADRRAGGHAVLDQPRRPPHRVRPRLADRHRRGRDRRRARAGAGPVRRTGHRARGGRPHARARGAGGQRADRRRVRAARASRC